MKTTTFLKKVMLVLMIAIIAFSTFACGDKNPSNGTSESTPDSNASESVGSESNTESESVSNVAITISIDKEEITVGETANITITVTGTDNPMYTLSFSEEGVIAVNNGVISIIAEDFTLAKRITITATAEADKSKSASKAINVQPARIEGQVGELTAEMIETLANPSITVTGVLTDVYTDYNQPLYSGSTSYDMVVHMEEGKWSGTWSKQVTSLMEDPVEITDIYVQSEDAGYVDAYGNEGHAMERLLINKNNEVERRMIKDYMSVPAVWEAQHLYNHLAYLNVNKFVYDPEFGVYEYVYDANDLEELYLLTYLSYSLTPLLQETIEKLYLVVENGAITKLIAETPVIYYDEYYDTNNQHHYAAMNETSVELTFSDIGTTVVRDPAPFVAGQYNDILKAAIEEMASATNYTFQAVENTTFAPSGGSGDYDVLSVASKNESVKAGNYTGSSGTVGIVGQITEDAILLADTIKYDYSMDDQLYRTEYTGYKNNGDGTYDHFKYSKDIPGFYGTKRVSGSLTDVLPTFDFAPEIFIYDSQYVKNGKTHIVFKLRETAINRDIAMEVSMHENADDAAADGSQDFTITVTEDGHLYETVYAYDLVSGTYRGNVSTVYGFLGTTELEEGLFDNYVPRKIIDSWDDFNVMYYTSSPSNGTYEEVTADVVLKSIFGEEQFANVPPVTVFIDIFGDNLNGPFFDWIIVGTDANGDNIYRGKMNFNTSATEYDENAKITNLDEVFAELEDVLCGTYGFTKSNANSGPVYGNTYICFMKEDVQIYVENNGTKHLWIYFCKSGDWTLKR